MNEKNKISIVKGKVSQAGYEDAICTFIKADENRNDSLSDKPLYIAEDLNITDDIYSITPNVTEALNRSPRKTIGAMNCEGNLILPIINSDVVKITNDYVAVKTTSSMQELETAKSDPAKAQDNTLIGQSIKNKILEKDQNARFICDDYYGVYNIYGIEGINLNKVSDDVSYIATNNDTIYAQSNRLEDDVQVIGKKIEEPNVTMPVENLADVTNMPLDNLGDLPQMPTELPGAPELNEEQSYFNIDEMQKELAGFENGIAMPSEINEPKEELHSIEQEKEVEIEKPRIIFTQPEIKNEREEITERKPIRVEFGDGRREKNDISSLVSAIKARLDKQEEEIKKLQDENRRKDIAIEDKEDEIKKLQNENSKRNYEIERLQSTLDRNEESLSLMQEEIKDKDDVIESLNRKAEKYQETMSTIYDEFSGILDNDNGRGRRYSKVA